MARYTLLQMVQSVLNDMDSEDVNSISDTVEATQIASIIRDTFYNLVTTKDIPEHYELLKVTALSDSDYPTHFQYPTNIRKLKTLWYKNSDDDYKEIYFVEPTDFLRKTDSVSENYDVVYDKNGGTELRIKNNQDPSFYTSFDDKYLVLNSYDVTVDSTLQASKVRAWGALIPTFTIDDAFTPDVDDTVFPYFLAESKSACMSLLKGTIDPKMDQAARRQKNFMQNDMYNTQRPNNWSKYGRS